MELAPRPKQSQDKRIAAVTPPETAPINTPRPPPAPARRPPPIMAQGMAPPRPLYGGPCGGGGITVRSPPLGRGGAPPPGRGGRQARRAGPPRARARPAPPRPASSTPDPPYAGRSGHFDAAARVCSAQPASPALPDHVQRSLARSRTKPTRAHTGTPPDIPPGAPLPRPTAGGAAGTALGRPSTVYATANPPRSPGCRKVPEGPPGSARISGDDAARRYAAGPLHAATQARPSRTASPLTGGTGRRRQAGVRAWRRGGREHAPPDHPRGNRSRPSWAKRAGRSQAGKRARGATIGSRGRGMRVMLPGPDPAPDPPGRHGLKYAGQTRDQAGPAVEPAEPAVPRGEHPLARREHAVPGLRPVRPAPATNDGSPGLPARHARAAQPPRRPA